MAALLNQDIGGRLEEVAQLLADQGASRFRIEAYRRAAATLRELNEPVSDIYAREGLAGLENLPAVGLSIARAIRDLLTHGRLAMLERLRGEHDPVALLQSVPGVGKLLAARLHDDLEISTLADLEAAAHDGRLELAGVGAKRLSGIRDSLAHRLGRVRVRAATSPTESSPSVEELLDVDAEYRRAAAANTLKKIAPRRFNRGGEAWLPILHTTRNGRHYTALFSNTARAHELGKTGDWVVLYYEDHHGEEQCTLITAQLGRLKGRRIVRGRERECEAHYHAPAAAIPEESRTASVIPT